MLEENTVSNKKVIKDYIEQKKELHNSLLDYIDNADYYDVNYNDLIRIIKKQNVFKNRNELEHFLRLLLMISNNHHRDAEFFIKIERVLKAFEAKIKQRLSNIQIFHIFMSNKIILLFLIKEKIITLDKIIINEIINFEKEKTPRYFHFFIPEIKEEADQQMKRKIEQEMKKIKYDENYFQKRLEGENDDYICSLIRNDLIIEFISFINKNHISTSSRIPTSIYETNEFLINNKPTLIEYAIFYGSIQIFNYLILSGAQISQHLWEFVIHSNNAEFIHHLEEKGIEPSDGTYEKCLEESIKCHHNSMSIYIKDNLLKNNKSQTKSQNSLEERIYSYCIKYENYLYFPEEFNGNYIFYCISKYRYLKLVKEFIKMKKKENKTKQMLANDLNNKEALSTKELYVVYDLLSRKNCISENFFYDCKQMSEMSIPSSIKSLDKCSFYGCKSLTRISIPSTVKMIGPFAFFGCSLLNEITIPSTVKTIGKSAFSECLSLYEIIIPSSMTTIEECCFYGCISLSLISIPSTITKIERHAFFGCTSLKEISIPSSVVSIKQSSFKECSSLSEIIFETPFSVEFIGKGAFERCQNLSRIIIPSSVIYIDNKVFGYYSKLTNILIPTSVTSIGNSAFYKCTSIAKISIPTLVTSIGDQAFSGCSSMAKISIPTSVASIKYSTFYECSSLTEITIPKSVISIGNYAFSECSGLQRISIPESVTSIGEYAFSRCIRLKEISISSSVTSIGKNAFFNCSSLTEIFIPLSITVIREYIFYFCLTLTKISFPASVISIENYSFYFCVSLKQIIIPASVTSIGNYAFSHCSSLVEISISSSVISIGNYAFSHCSSLVEISISSSLASIGNHAFYECSKLNEISIPFFLNPERIGLSSEVKVNIK